MGNMLVVGAREGSLGAYVADVARERGWTVVTAGVSGEEHLRLDVANHRQVYELFELSTPWHSVVCTAGVNHEGSIQDQAMRGKLDQSFLINATGPLHLLHVWAEWWLYHLDEGFMVTNENDGTQIPAFPLHYVAISSNSAHIARSKSLAYCASKAALSMGIRCAARDLAGTWLNVYGYEPGWLSGTPMSKEVNKRFEYGMPRHRIPGDRTVDPAALAHMIVRNVANWYSSLNGCMLRLDGGEQ